MRRSTLAVTSVVLVLFAAAGRADVEMHTDAGVVEGESVERARDAAASAVGVRVFKGIPYAAPPVDENRWRPPQPVEPWSRPLVADAFQPGCLQGAPTAVDAADEARIAAEARHLRADIRARLGGSRPSNNARLGRLPPLAEAATDEDCLYLNVWTGADRADARLPVLVWFFGGGFTRGTATDARYDGSVLASGGAVVVTFDYRLGVLGFLAHPELSEESGTASSGNFGLLDGIAALQWVQRNIAAFGGDPDNVTAIGSASGAAMIAALIASPLGEGLFGKAILQGGWMATTLAPLPTLAEAERIGVEIVARQEADSIDDLRGERAESFALEASPGLIVDGYLLKEDPAVTFAAGRQRRVDVLVGSNHDEGLTFVPLDERARPDQDAARFVATARARFGPLADRYLELYPASSNAEATQSFVRAYGEELAWSMRRLAEAQAAVGASSYVYLFAHEPPLFPREPERQKRGAQHATEIPYVFGNLDGTYTPYAAGDRQLSDVMRAYWLGFARTSVPRGPSAEWPEWPSLAQDRDVAMVFDAAIAPRRIVAPGPAELYDAAFELMLDGIVQP